MPPVSDTVTSTDGVASLPGLDVPVASASPLGFAGFTPSTLCVACAGSAV